MKIAKSNLSQEEKEDPFANVDWMVAQIISHKLATLKELQEYYSYEDLMIMWESLVVYKSEGN